MWIGDSLSQMEVLSIRSHLKQSHRYHLWSYSALENVPDGVVLEDARQILDESEVFAYRVGEGKGSFSAFSNLFRYKLLLDRGGWWCDTDVVALKPFDFTEDILFASEREQSMTSVPTTCVIKLPAGSEIAAYCYQKAASVNRNTVRWGQIGPDLLKKAIEQFDLHSAIKSPETFCPIDWFEAPSKFVSGNAEIKESHAVHLWHEMWRRSGINKSNNPSSLYSKLLESHDLL